MRGERRELRQQDTRQATELTTAGQAATMGQEASNGTCDSWTSSDGGTRGDQRDLRQRTRGSDENDGSETMMIRGRCLNRDGGQ
ncbi:hypothetical protein ACOSP7_032907 [Xanthoceras sorbifolium]